MSGLELLQRLPRGETAPRTVIYTGAATDALIAAALAHGVSAFVEKGASIAELMASLRAVVRGEFPLNPRLSAVLRTLVRQQKPRRDLGALDRQVLRKLALRQSTREIARELGLSASGVYKVRARLASRLGLTAREGFFTAAASLGLVPPPPAFSATARSAPSPSPALHEHPLP
jgi:DNA-binding NarL/FixJ family response regulator